MTTGARTNVGRTKDKSVRPTTGVNRSIYLFWPGGWNPVGFSLTVTIGTPFGVHLFKIIAWMIRIYRPAIHIHCITVATYLDVLFKSAVAVLAQ